MRNILRLSIAAGAAALLAGCATVDIDDAARSANEAAPGFTQGRLELERTQEQRQRRERLTEDLLGAPLTMDGAVQLALANSPALQALLAQGASDMAAAAQSGRIANPLFSFERVRAGSELELGRLLSVGLLDLLTLPQRRIVSRNREAQARMQLTADVVEHVSRVRQAWVRAVAAGQMLRYAGQVNESAEASAELARRMQQAGNFTRLQRARQHAFYADATAQLASAAHAATAAREELVRLLGLTDAQAGRLRLPERLPDLPKEPLAAPRVSESALAQRIDVRLARLQLDAAGKAEGLELLERLADVELGGRRDTIFDNAAGTKHHRYGYELEIRLPLFDWGDAGRTRMSAQALAAARRHEAVSRAASSQLRESYSAYRTAYDLARHYQSEIVPLRKTISDEQVLRYNGMLIGVFELLADSREQISAVLATIAAQQQFWLADASLSAALVGKPMATSEAAAPAGASSPASASAAH